MHMYVRVCVCVCDSRSACSTHRKSADAPGTRAGSAIAGTHKARGSCEHGARKPQTGSTGATHTRGQKERKSWRRTGYTRGLRHRRERVERWTERSYCRLGETPTFLPQGSTCPPPELVKHSWRELNAFLQGICPSLVQPWTCVYNAPGIRAGSATGGHRRERVERANGSR